MKKHQVNKKSKIYRICSHLCFAMGRASTVQQQPLYAKGINVFSAYLGLDAYTLEN